MANPFHWRGMVTDPEAFVGRQQELKALFSRLDTLGSVSVVGPRRIGKSSLLWQACGQACQRIGFYCRPVYLDMLSAQHHTLNGLCGEILRKVDAAADEVMNAVPQEKLGAFERELCKARGKGILPVVFVDEFEVLAELRAQFGDNLLMSWRSLTNAGQIAFVTSSQQPLEFVAHKAGLTSPFYNIFSTIELGMFTDQESEQFIECAMRVGGFSADEGRFIARVGNMHPLKMQLTAWHLFEDKHGRPPRTLPEHLPDFPLIEDLVRKDMDDMLGHR